MRFQRWIRFVFFGGLTMAAWGLMAGDVPAADHGDAEVSHEADLHGDGAEGHDDHAGGDHGHDEHGAHGGAGSTNPVTVDPDLAWVTAIIFLILLAVLWKFAWGPIVQALDQREQTVASQLAEAKENQERAQQLLADHEAKLAGTATEVKQMLDQARKDAESNKQQIMESAQAAASAEKERALREIEAAKNAALQDLAEKSVDSAVVLASQIVKRQLNEEDHSKLIGEALDRFSSN